MRTMGWMRAVVLGGVVLAMGTATAWAGDPFVKPTDEELKMTSLPGYPGAAAVVLNREEITDDDNHSQVHYQRIKVLTEKGKEYANVELRFFTGKGDGYYDGDDKNITDIQGRTIHPDGTIVAFTGKPYLKTFVNAEQFKYQARVFTLPDVEVGSIIEYRYVIRIADNIFEAPDWYIQGDLFVRKAHYKWLPTTKELGSSKGTVNSIAYFPILPVGTDMAKSDRPGGGGRIFELNVKDVPPSPHDSYMPPIESFSYRVNFYYMAYRSIPEFWKSEGNDWSKRMNSFTGPDGSLRAKTQEAIAGAATNDEKLRKIYAAVMAMENTDYTRSRDKAEDKAAGVGKVSHASDVFTLKRGSSTQLTEVFVGMARAAGMEAYFGYVPDRSKTVFTASYLSFSQFDDVVAIVNVDGKEKFFDPGARYCDYGRMAWEDSFAAGIRQTSGGTDFMQTPGDDYKVNTEKRIGDLTLEPNGEVHGTLSETFEGAPALEWRQRALRGDEESVRRGLRESVEELVPKTLEVKVASVDGIEGYDKPLVVKYDVHGTIGTATGKRLLLPADVFMASEAEAFPHEKREVPVYFHYAAAVLDAVRVKYPAGMTLEAAPETAKATFKTSGAYSLTPDVKPGSVTIRRNQVFNGIIVPVGEYPDLRKYYADMEAKDHEPVVMKVAAAN